MPDEDKTDANDLGQQLTHSYFRWFDMEGFRGEIAYELYKSDIEERQISVEPIQGALCSKIT